MRHWGIALVATFASLSLVACKKQVDKASVQDSVKKQLADAGFGDVAAACPDGVEAKKGATFTCKVTIEGQTYDFQIEVTGVEGQRVDMNTKFAKGTAFPRQKLVDLLVPAVKEKINAEPSIDCGKEPLLFATDDKIYCAITSGENKGKLRVDVEGTNVKGWEIEAAE